MRIIGTVTRVVAEESTNGVTHPPRIFFAPSSAKAAAQVDGRHKFASGELALPVTEAELADFKVGEEVVADFTTRKFVRGESVVTEDKETAPE